MSDPAGPDVRVRAAIAAGSVTALFGRRLLHLPGTELGAVRWPLRRGWPMPWHYWWQAHYLDCLVDAGWREHRADLPVGSLRPAHRLLAGLWLRNLLHFPNAYYDDMAWLALAVSRLDELTRTVEDRHSRRCRRAIAALAPQLASAMTDDIGGGLFWNRKRDFKNTPATAPAALFFARTGDRPRARSLVNWLQDRLLDAGSGLYLDGLRPRGAELHVVRDLYTYNQGPVLGALLELGEPQDLCAAGRLVHAIDAGLTRQDGGRRPLVTHGDGDGGLFTGILARYLAVAATDARLGGTTRTTAATLVRDTADGFWAGRRPAHASTPHAGSTHAVTDDGAGAGAGVLVFPADPAGQDDAVVVEAVELSTQLQAWMTFEAAALIARDRANSSGEGADGTPAPEHGR